MKPAALGAHLALATITVLVALAPSSSMAAVAVSPPDGTLYQEGDSVDLQWELTPDEQAKRLRASNGIPDDEVDLNLAPDQTGFQFTNVPAGHWQWTVETCRPSGFFCSSFTQKATGHFSVFDVLSLAEAKGLVRQTVERETHSSDLRFRKLRCKVVSGFKAQCKFIAIVSGFLVVAGKGRVALSATDIEENLSGYEYRFRVIKASAYCVLKPTHNTQDCLVKEKW